MSVPTTNVKLNEHIGVEFGRTIGQETSLTSASTGIYGTINTASPMYPDGTAQHAISEFFNYDHDAIIDNPPNAVIGGSTTGVTNNNVSLNAYGSTDDNGIASYSWSNNRNSQTSSSVSYTVSYGSATTMTVTLTITDTAGQTDTDTHTITWSAPSANSTSLRYSSSNSSTEACYFGPTVTVYHTGTLTLGTTMIYTDASLSTFAPSGAYGIYSQGAWNWNGLGWSQLSSC